MNWTEAYLLADMEAEEMMSAEETADRIKQLVAANETQAAEIERLRAYLDRIEKLRKLERRLSSDNPNPWKDV
jgi:Tfp pilus assembly protein PilO